MIKKIKNLIVYLLVASLIGCSSTPPQAIQPKEYAYLASFVKKDVRWGPDEWFSFITHLNDKHLSELSLDWGVLQETSPGINVIWGVNKQKFISVGNSKLALDSLGGRQKTINLLQKEINDAAYTFSMFKGGVKWHEIVSWADEKKGVNKSEYAQNSFDAERSLLNKIFEKNWDKLTPEQRKAVIEKSKLSDLSAKDKAVMITATGIAARATLGAAIAMSGFSFYTTMSSVIAAMANVIGVTLPFAVYTGASSTVGALTGPVGWALLAAGSTGLGLYAMSPDEEKVSRMIISLHILKAKVHNDSIKQV